MHLDPTLPTFVVIVLVALALAITARWIKQPLIIGYILAGVVLGPEILGFVEDRSFLARLGEVGVILLLFLIGLEISLEKLTGMWRIALLGTGAQILISVGVAFLLGWIFSWPYGRSLLIGFVLALSSTAVILRMIQDSGGLTKEPGSSVMAILIAQDIALVPMMIILAFFGAAAGDEPHMVQQIIGAVAVILILVVLGRVGTFSLPFRQLVRRDPELQVLYSLAVCFGLATLTGLFSLSAALGAFLAGMIVHATRETHWVETSLNGFRVVFMGAFFIAIGMLVDFAFILDHAIELILLIVLSLTVNTAINALILRANGLTWRDAFAGGAMLAQLGEFGIVLAGIGLASGLIYEEGYKLTLTVITATLALSPLWIQFVVTYYDRVPRGVLRSLTRMVRRRKKPAPRPPTA